MRYTAYPYQFGSERAVDGRTPKSAARKLVKSERRNGFRTPLMSYIVDNKTTECIGRVMDILPELVKK
jgi:hypothetical protein